MTTQHPLLFSPLEIGKLTLRNRICSTGHDTCLAEGSVPGEALAAYHEARARGGAGLIVVQVAGVHDSARYTGDMLLATTDDCIPGYRRIAEACHAHGCAVVGQLFHPGREILSSPDGAAPVAYSASAVPNERFHVMPRAAPRAVIREIVNGFGAGARRLARAGLDGVEIVASHGYLPEQFLNPRVNRRSDEYGGSRDGRLRFLRECIDSIRQQNGDRVVGLRICVDSVDPNGLTPEEVVEICADLDADGGLDYFSVAAGSSAGLAGSIHIAPPMGGEPNGYVASSARRVREAVTKPVIVTGRITLPRTAEAILERAEADACGMTRAMICDPELGNKARDGRSGEIRECIGCNQACIGHMHLGHPISCIQHPESGRELRFTQPHTASRRRRVMVVGGGPAGMKAAAIAAARGHEVTLYERAKRLGGQALLAQLLPGRADFGGLVSNLTRELEAAGVEIVTGREVDVALIDERDPDAIVLATGARPRRPEIPGMEEARVVDAWEVLQGQAEVGASVAIADWRCDWIGLGLAERLAREGRRVRLCVNGTMPGQTIQQYVRDPWLGTLSQLGVEIVPMARLVAVDATAAYFEHTISRQPVICDDLDTLVLSLGHDAVDDLEARLQGREKEVIPIGDCLCPRTAEEAVLEGLRVGWSI